MNQWAHRCADVVMAAGKEKAESLRNEGRKGRTDVVFLRDNPFTIN